MSKEKIISDDIPEEVQEILQHFPVKGESKETSNIQIRYILAAMGFWCFFVLAALRVNLSIGIVAMVNWKGITKDMEPSKAAQKQVCDFKNKQSHTQNGPFMWDPHIQGHILSCYFYGLAATQLAGGRIAELVSAKYVLLVGTAVATLMNFFIPLAASNKGYGVMALQVFKGFGQGIVMPAFSVLLGKWVPPSERGRFMSVVASGLPVGAFFTVVISGIICKMPSLGWPFVFYVFGVVAVLWCIFWAILIYDSPLTHPYITKRELNRIMTLRTQKAPVLYVKIPVKKILTSPHVWAYIAAGFASFWALCLYVSVVPMFLGTVLKFDIETNGLMAAMPSIAEAFMLFCISSLSERLLKKKLLTATTIRKACIGTGLIGFSVCILLVTFTGCHRVLTVLFLVLALGMSGFSFASTAVVPVDMAPRFAGTISGIMNTLGALSGVIIPTMVGYLTRDAQTMAEWSIVFYISAIIGLLGAIFFICFGSSKQQSWNNPPGEDGSSSSQEPLEEQEEHTSRKPLGEDENKAKKGGAKSSKSPAPPPPSPTNQKEGAEADPERQKSDETHPDLPPNQKTPSKAQKSASKKDIPAAKSSKSTAPIPPSPKNSRRGSTDDPERPWRDESFPDLQPGHKKPVTIKVPTDPDNP